MKFIFSRMSFGHLLSRSKILSVVLRTFSYFLFRPIRLVVKLFAYTNDTILIISLNRIGDTVFTIPAIKNLEEQIKKKIVIACYPESVPIYKIAFKGIDYCELDHSDFFFNDRFVKFKVKKKLKAYRPEIIVDLIGSMASALLIFDIRAKKIIGLHNEQFKAVYDCGVKFRQTPQLVDIYLDALSPIVDVSNLNTRFISEKSANREGEILIHPFASWKEKEWNVKRFFKLARILKNKYQVNFIISKGQLSQDTLDEFGFESINIIQTSSLQNLIKYIKECSLLIGNDSGPINLANFLGKPSFTIYGATNPDYTTTCQKHQLSIQKKLACSARDNEKFCIVGGAQFICSGIQCMDILTVDEVYNNLKPILEEYCVHKF